MLHNSIYNKFIFNKTQVRIPELINSLGSKFTGREMTRSFNQREAFKSQIIPREVSNKATSILADKRNYMSTKEKDNIQHSLINCSKNLRQNINDDKYNVSINRCQLFMDKRNGTKKYGAGQNDFETTIYQCASLQLVLRTNTSKQSKQTANNNSIINTNK